MPDIPNDVMDRIDKLSESIPILSGFSKNLIKTLQTHPDKTKTLEGKQLESAALVGIEIMEELHKEFKEKKSPLNRSAAEHIRAPSCAPNCLGQTPAGISFT